MDGKEPPVDWASWRRLLFAAIVIVLVVRVRADLATRPPDPWVGVLPDGEPREAAAPDRHDPEAAQWREAHEIGRALVASVPDLKPDAEIERRYGLPVNAISDCRWIRNDWMRMERPSDRVFMLEYDCGVVASDGPRRERYELAVRAVKVDDHRWEIGWRGY